MVVYTKGNLGESRFDSPNIPGGPTDWPVWERAASARPKLGTAKWKS